MYSAFKDLKLKHEFKPRVDNLVFRLHYRYTLLLFMVGATLSTLYDFVGAKIICMVDTSRRDIKAVVNTFCYITGTYTVDKYHDPPYTADGYYYPLSDPEIPHVGVGPYNKEEDDITYHTYYQWVPFVLVAQGTLFYVPHYIWKLFERGLFKSIIQNLSIRDYLGGKLSNFEHREEQFQLLANYIHESFSKHRSWAYKFLFCEFLNICVTAFVVWTTNMFLGGMFFTYGIEVFSISGMDPENRTDPMSQVFPQMGKCNFQMYGPSGSIEKRDVMCLLPTNVANEKIYITLWLWLVILFWISVIWMIYRTFSSIRCIREPLFKFRVVTLTRFWKKGLDNVDSRLATSEEVNTVLDNFPKFSDFVLLSQLGDNMEASLFSEFIHHLATRETKGNRNSAASTDSGVDDPYADEKKKLASLDDDSGEIDYRPSDGPYPNLNEKLPKV